ncbi:syntaxin-8-like [Plakobranchus ocellatus]|uniref:Syntaxin-8 n=1 Tax=Plakobranchus ocellatus TaxID=259542 RepID=A0AAV4CD05_9GAST|nr:syntaxin-8-like [Plakobranchus ocellatus]
MLLAGSGGPGADTFSSNDPWGMGSSDPDRYNDISNADLHQQQQHIIMEQDRGLDALSDVIGRQKQMALDIGNEVDDQNELLDDINERVDRTDNRIQRETRHIKLVDRKSNTCCYYVVIILLFVAIVIIAAVPYKGKP